MKIRIIDLLNKISNNEQPPKKIAFKEYVYNYNEEVKDYYNEIEDYLFDTYVITDILNDEVVILETEITLKQDKKIEKLQFDMSINFIDQFTDKINEIIEVLNER